MDKRRNILRVCIAVIALFSFASIFLAVKTVYGLFHQPVVQKEQQPQMADVQKEITFAQVSPQETKTLDGTEPWGMRVAVNGEDWRMKSGIHSLLFMGIDDTAHVEINGISGEMGVAEAIFLLVLDDADNEIKCLVFPYDAEVPIKVYDENGSMVGPEFSLLGNQYAFSRSPSRGTMMMKRKVSEMMHGISVDGYVSISFDGIGKIADAIGGMRVPLTLDWTDVDSAFTPGCEVTLDSETVAKFVDAAHNGDESLRNARQEWLLMTMLKQMRKVYSKSFQDQLNPSTGLKMEVDADLIQKLKESKFDDEIIRVPGSEIEGSGRFRVDWPAFDDVLLELFYDIS